MDTKQIFSQQLITVMRKAGFTSSRSPSGVCLKKLAEITGTSIQMCRRYIKGEVLPDHKRLLKLASAFNISPGLLLFGNTIQSEFNKPGILCIETDVLRHIFEKYHEVMRSIPNEKSEAAITFIIQFIENLSSIETDSNNIKKLVDTVFKGISLSSQSA